jgi:hypothetical protein
MNVPPECVSLAVFAVDRDGRIPVPAHADRGDEHLAFLHPAAQEIIAQHGAELAQGRIIDLLVCLAVDERLVGPLELPEKVIIDELAEIAAKLD